MPELVISADLRAAVVARAYGCCEYCCSQERFATESFSVEHILPRSKGGATALGNLALSCQGCNNHKYTRTVIHDPASWEPVALFHPRRQVWNAHFTWNEDYTLVVGLTPTRRATVEVLRLNRAGVVNLRRVLYRLG